MRPCGPANYNNDESMSNKHVKATASAGDGHVKSSDSIRAESECESLLQLFGARNVNSSDTGGRNQRSTFEYLTPGPEGRSQTGTKSEVSPASPTDSCDHDSHNTGQKVLVQAHIPPEELAVAELGSELSQLEHDLDSKIKALSDCNESLQALVGERCDHHTRQNNHQEYLDNLNKRDKSLKMLLKSARAQSKLNKEKDSELKGKIDAKHTLRDQVRKSINDLQKERRKLGARLSKAEKELDLVREFKDEILRSLARLIRGLPPPQSQQQERDIKNGRCNIKYGSQVADSDSDDGVPTANNDEGDWNNMAHDEVQIGEFVALKRKVDALSDTPDTQVEKEEDKAKPQAESSKRARIMESDPASLETSPQEDNETDEYSAAALHKDLDIMLQARRRISAVMTRLRGTSTKRPIAEEETFVVCVGASDDEDDHDHGHEERNSGDLHSTHRSQE